MAPVNGKILMFELEEIDSASVENLMRQINPDGQLARLNHDYYNQPDEYELADVVALLISREAALALDIEAARSPYNDYLDGPDEESDSFWDEPEEIEYSTADPDHDNFNAGGATEELIVSLGRSPKVRIYLFDSDGTYEVVDMSRLGIMRHPHRAVDPRER